MTERSASAPIKGYEYQFIHTLCNILTCDDENTECRIEGIEDLDIEEDLFQYKHHEEPYVPSKIGKPIGIMFEHYIRHKDSCNNFKYRLFAYFTDANPEHLTMDDIKYILGLKAAQEHINNKANCGDNTIIEDFFSKFNYTAAEKYETLEKNVKELLTKICIDNLVASSVYYPNALQLIREVAINKNAQERKITKKELIEKLKARKNTLYSNWIYQRNGFLGLQKEIKAIKKSRGLAMFQASYVVYFENENRQNLSQLILDLAKKIRFRGGKTDNKPLTIIVSSKNIQNIKVDLCNKIFELNEAIVFNDGYESYNSFNVNIFNLEPISTPYKNISNKIGEVNYHFKIVSMSTMQKYETTIVFKNPCLFIVDAIECDVLRNCDNRYFLPALLSNEQILQIIGEDK